MNFFVIYDYLIGNVKKVNNNLNNITNDIGNFFKEVFIFDQKSALSKETNKEFLEKLVNKNKKSDLENWVIGYCYEKGIILNKDLYSSMMYYSNLSSSDTYLNILRVIVENNLAISSANPVYRTIKKVFIQTYKNLPIKLSTIKLKPVKEFVNESQSEHYKFILHKYFFEKRDYATSYLILKECTKNLFALKKLILLSEYFVQPSLYGYSFKEIDSDNENESYVLNSNYEMVDTQFLSFAEPAYWLEPFHYFKEYLELENVYLDSLGKMISENEAYEIWLNKIYKRAMNGDQISNLMLGLIYFNNESLIESSKFFENSLNKGNKIAEAINNFLKNKKNKFANFYLNDESKSISYNAQNQNFTILDHSLMQFYNNFNNSLDHYYKGEIELSLMYVEEIIEFSKIEDLKIFEKLISELYNFLCNDIKTIELIQKELVKLQGIEYEQISVLEYIDYFRNKLLAFQEFAFIDNGINPSLYCYLSGIINKHKGE